MIKLSSEEYVRQGGNYCPNCLSSKVTFIPETLEPAGGSCTFEVHCLSCDWTWLDEYTLTGYAQLTPPTE